ncbi:hypothetical protein CYMTET_20157 [Cymbomonas tetramitiformis]|uniref:Right handed beta helix domain-containing protein n=1 Tax=Cymbomonas tetramitiformis TaxID=36881 RepID=A0AAE0G599_9CHLO|nr:hypothetical protein CYMTET_20157 [Cymbomonas tetramitiformis]
MLLTFEHSSYLARMRYCTVFAVACCFIRASLANPLHVDPVQGVDEPECGAEGSTASCATIQYALDKAENGDQVLLTSGAYSGRGNFDLRFLGKSVHLYGSPDTIIDCEGQGRGIVFENGEGSTSLVDGITITGCNSLKGSAILFVNGASPEIRNSIFSNCTADVGAGIYVGEGSSPTFRNVTIRENVALSGQGGGAYVTNASRPVFIDSEVSHNCALTEGGGFSVTDDAVLSLTNTSVIQNSANSSGGGLAASGSSIVKLLKGSISKNTAVLNGGGLHITETARLSAQNLSIFYNHAISGGGGGLALNATSVPAAITTDVVSGLTHMHCPGNTTQEHRLHLEYFRINQVAEAGSAAYADAHLVFSSPPDADESLYKGSPGSTRESPLVEEGPEIHADRHPSVISNLSDPTAVGWVEGTAVNVTLPLPHFYRLYHLEVEFFVARHLGIDLPARVEVWSGGDLQVERHLEAPALEKAARALRRSEVLPIPDVLASELTVVFGDALLASDADVELHAELGNTTATLSCVPLSTEASSEPAIGSEATVVVHSATAQHASLASYDECLLAAASDLCAVSTEAGSCALPGDDMYDACMVADVANGPWWDHFNLAVEGGGDIVTGSVRGTEAVVHGGVGAWGGGASEHPDGFPAHLQCSNDTYLEVAEARYGTSSRFAVALWVKQGLDEGHGAGLEETLVHHHAPATGEAEGGTCGDRLEIMINGEGAIGGLVRKGGDSSSEPQADFPCLPPSLYR